MALVNHIHCDELYRTWTYVIQETLYFERFKSLDFDKVLARWFSHRLSNSIYLTEGLHPKSNRIFFGLVTEAGWVVATHGTLEGLLHYWEMACYESSNHDAIKFMLKSYMARKDKV